MKIAMSRRSAGVVLKKATSRSLAALSAVWVTLTLCPAHGEPRHSQTVNLVTGWNAVYLELDPDLSDPANTFAGQPVDVVASYVPAQSRAQFVEDPQAQLLRAYGWSVWYAPQRSDAFLSSLYAIQGAKPYLIHATTNTTIELVGTLPPTPPVGWMADAFNLVGFSVADPGAPTFQQFFSGSPAHAHNRIYRLVNGTWRQVLTPDTELMRSGEAFWIYCDGHSTYPGPLEVTTSSHLGVVLSSRSGSDLVLRNRVGHPLAVTIVNDAVGNGNVPLSVPVRAYDPALKVMGTLTVELGGGSWTQSFPPLEVGAAMRLPLQLRLSDMNPGTQHALLKVLTDLGTVTYVAVTATRDDQP